MITAIDRPLRLAGVPAGSWAFGIRIWLAVVVALAASFWLELEVPSAAAVTVAILAEPTRGRALEKAFFRLIATVIGVSACRAFQPHARAKKLPRAVECLVYSLTPSGVLAENHPKIGVSSAFLRGSKMPKETFFTAIS